ncbi:MAG: hypothetical protein JRJ68_14240 [Deltaproteobacteria bacterium]|nr:hypothetical protein [Deltaproteobacteria bacterium]
MSILTAGRGILVSSDGSRFEGEFTFGQRDGKGVFTRNDGRVFEGIFRNDKMVKGK